MRLFGSLQCRTELTDAALPARPGARALFAALAIATAPVRREWLAAVLWPEVTDVAARANLRRHVLYVDRWIAGLTGISQPIVRGSRTIALHPDVIAWSDVRAFEAALADNALEDAAAMYRADLLDGMDDDWVAAERLRLRARYDELLQTLVARLGARGEHDAALAYADTGQRLDPYNEPWLRTAMRLRYSAGDRAGALRRFEAYAALVRTDLDIAPSRETVMLADSMRRRMDVNAEPPLRSTELTTFVGRSAELRQLADLISQSRLVTVAGAPGTGKSRLSIQAARTLAGRFRDGLVIVDAASAHDARTLEHALQRAFVRAGEPSADVPIVWIAERDVLVVIDGCERLRDACARMITKLLACGRHVRFLASSRVPLGVSGERVYRLPPLRLADAATLFEERANLARAEQSELRLDPAAVERICRKLECSPLAIELAAARLGASTLQELERDLNGNVHAPAMQLLNTLYESSYQRLTALERAVLRRLAAFVDGWSLDIGVAACEGLAERRHIVETIATLVEHSLVVPPGVTAAAPRYAMLDATREFAFGQAAALDELEADRRAHARATAAHYAAMSERLRGLHAAEAYADIERDHENIDRALTTLWTDTTSHALATDLSLSLSRFWTDQGFAKEGEGWLRKALGNVLDDMPKRLELLRVIGTLTRDRGDYLASFHDFCEIVALHERTGSGPVEIARAQTMAANAARMTGDFDEAARRTILALDAFTANGEAYLAAWAVYALGTTLLCAGRLAAAAVELERATARFNELNAVADSSSSIANLALCHFYAGRLDVALELARESVARARSAGHRYYVAHAMLNEALIRNALGQHEQAWPLIVEATVIACGLGAHDVAICCAETACALLALSQPDEAALLLGSTDSVRERLHAFRFPIDEPLYDDIRSKLRAILGAERLEALTMRGRVTPLPELLARLDRPSPHERAADAIPATGGLTM